MVELGKYTGTQHYHFQKCGMKSKISIHRKYFVSLNLKSCGFEKPCYACYHKSQVVVNSYLES